MEGSITIKPNDLRLGNYLQDKLTGELLQVETLSNEGSGGFTAKVLDRSKYPLPEGWSAEPITVTEEWLEKLGFHKPTDAIDWHSPHKDTQCSHTGLWEKHVFDFNDMEYVVNSNPYDDESVKIMYVHKLQNLYHALTGEELELQKEKA